ncbi:7139_t:CDS:2, partial [Diversispora eburnea]
MRLARHGIRNRPFYHIVVANAKSPRDGKHIEQVGIYDPIPDANGVKHIEWKENRIKYWLTVGAQPSFNHIYCINLPSRSDRREKVTTIAKYHNLDIDFIEAINKDDAKTLKHYLSDLAPPHKTCYASHYKTYELVVSNNYQSALILEDDVDFEVNIKDFLNAVQPFLPNNWEMFYLGNCAWDTSDIIYYNGADHGSDLILSKSLRPACSHAYAVSLRGAKKLLEILVNVSKPVDVALIDLMLADKIFSLSLSPSIINQWKSKDDPSNISSGSQDEPHKLKNSTLELF